jgi:hypothetical protein
MAVEMSCSGFNESSVMGVLAFGCSNVIVTIELAHCPHGQVSPSLPFLSAANHMR